MRRFSQLWMICFLVFSLTGCCLSHRFDPFPRSYITEDCWQRQLIVRPNCWTRHADKWFLTGEPNCVEEENRCAPPSAAITTTRVRVADFRNIKVCGSFQTQIFGTQEHNTVYVYGPNVGVRNIAVTVRGDTLFVQQIRPDSPCTRRVIIRIGMRDLHNLTQFGNGSIEAVQINACECINIKSLGSGAIYLSGHSIPLNKLYVYGRGSVNIFGVNSCRLDITSLGCGCVNLVGKVGLRSITHGGSGNISIIGAKSRGLCVNAGGSGKISIRGHVNIKKIQARNNIHLYIGQSTSRGFCACVADCARVGIDGFAGDLEVNTYDYSRFWGKHLCVLNAYVRAHNESHINVTARNKIFAAATDYSSIYFYGSPRALSQFASQHANIITMAIDSPACCTPMCVADLYQMV